MPRGRLTPVLSAAFVSLAAPAAAQWTVVSLHPPGPTYAQAHSEGLAIDASHEVGRVDLPTGFSHAGLWSGTASSWVDLHPAAHNSSRAEGVHAGQQVGMAYLNGTFRASLWSGTAASWVSLNPAGAGGGWAEGVHAGQQVGNVWLIVDGVRRASLWSGTAASWVDLHPTGATSSNARAVHGAHQAGIAAVGGNPHASLWSGTAASWVDLHPAGAVSSTATAVHNGQVVGTTEAATQRAALWSGTAGSWVDLHPPEATGSSGAFGVHNGRQVGFAVFGGVSRAVLWTGSAASWEDLSLALSGSWGSTSANGIWSDGTTVRVIGGGFNVATGRFEALLWTRLIAGCYPDCNGDGALNLADFGCFQTKFALLDPYADCNGDQILNLADFGCFQTKFALGCR